MRIPRAGLVGEGTYSVLIWELIHSLFFPFTHEMDYIDIYPHLSLLLPVENETLYAPTSRLPHVHEGIRGYLWVEASLLGPHTGTCHQRVIPVSLHHPSTSQETTVTPAPQLWMHAHPHPPAKTHTHTHKQKHTWVHVYL